MCSPGGNRVQVRFCEAKVGPDRIKATQIRFLEVALRFHRPADFMIIEVAGPSMPGVAGRRSKRAWRAVEQDRQPYCAALRQPDATAVVFAGELQLNATVPVSQGQGQ
jgi:hypothetical protein